MKLRKAMAFAVVATGLTTTTNAQESVHNTAFTINGLQHNISQSAIDPALVASFFRLDPECESICIAPLTKIVGVKTMAEPDVIAFMADEVASGRGLIIDSRSPEDRLRGYLPASVNVPSRLISPENPLLEDIMMALGATVEDGVFAFDAAMPLLVYDAGPMESDAATLINSLIKQGYPTHAIRYYRGGMLVWTALGLTTEGISK